MFMDRRRRGSRPGEAAEPLPCGRIEDRQQSPNKRFACGTYLPLPRPNRTEGPAPKRDAPAAASRPPLRGSLGNTVGWLEEKSHRQLGSPVAAAPPKQFLFEAISAEWLRQ